MSDSSPSNSNAAGPLNTSGPLKGMRIVEMAGIGPGPFACMLLSDMGAEVIRVDRVSPSGLGSLGGNPTDFTGRGRRSIAVDLKQAEGVETVLKLVETADAIVEGFRPGVMEKLGLGPDICSARNPKLVYARMTGWGQEGPLAHAAGHDINYVALTGALAAIGTEESGPVPPLNLVGDYAGGSLYLVMGILAALWEARGSGQGQVVDCAITDGVINLMTAIQGFRAMGFWDPTQRQANMLDGASHYYDTYECADGKYITLGSIEPQFYALLVEKLGVDIGEPGFETQFDKAKWVEYKPVVAARIKTKTRAEWCEIMEGTDVCFAPVLDMNEAEQHPHNIARGNFFEQDGFVQSAPAPRFARTPSKVQGSPVAPGTDSRAVLADVGLDDAAISGLLGSGAVAQAE